MIKEDKMIKTLVSHGNSAAPIIDKPMLELLKVTMDTLLEITTDGESLVISPVHDRERGEKFRTALKRSTKNTGKR